MDEDRLASLAFFSEASDLLDLKTKIVEKTGLDKSKVETLIKYVYLFGDLGDGSAIVENDILKGRNLKVVQIVISCFLSKAKSTQMSFDSVFAEISSIS